MRAIVISDGTDRRSVATYVRARSAGRHRIATPVTSAARRIAVPVADSQFRLNTAASGAAVATTGGTRNTALSSPAIGSFGAEMPFSSALTCGSPHAKTRTLKTIHGRYAGQRPPCAAVRRAV